MPIHSFDPAINNNLLVPGEYPRAIAGFPYLTPAGAADLLERLPVPGRLGAEPELPAPTW